MVHLPHCPAAAGGRRKKPSGLRSICNARPKLWHDRDESPRACHGIIRSRTGPSRALLQDTTGTVSALARSPSRRQRTQRRQAALWPVVPGQRGSRDRMGACTTQDGNGCIHQQDACTSMRPACHPLPKRKPRQLPGLDVAKAGGRGREAQGRSGLGHGSAGAGKLLAELLDAAGFDDALLGARVEWVRLGSDVQLH